MFVGGAGEQVILVFYRVCVAECAGAFGAGEVGEPATFTAEG